jgi:hypothetical protein
MIGFVQLPAARMLAALCTAVVAALPARAAAATTGYLGAIHTHTTAAPCSLARRARRQPNSLAGAYSRRHVDMARPPSPPSRLVS